MKKYDVFISYRRVDEKGNISGRDIARTIQKELQLRKYKVFFDYSDIRDNAFEETILPAIQASAIFILVLTRGALERCANTSDWVRREIFTAIQSDCKIIPVNPDNKFDGWPSTFPEELASIKRYQISDIHMGSLFEVSISKLEEDRIKPVINHTSSKTMEEQAERKKSELLSQVEADFTSQEYLTNGNHQLFDDQLPYNYQPVLPSLFSRFWLFDRAFINLAKISPQDNKKGFLSQLASECMDLLEFLFIYASHPDLHIRRISLKHIISDINSQSTFNNNNLLAALKQDITQLPPYYICTDVFIFIFRNQIIGGTSPFTLVFTSPQCKSKFLSWTENYYGIKRQALFKESASFRERGELFQGYLKGMLATFPHENSLYQYIKSQSDSIFYSLSSSLQRKDSLSLMSPERIKFPSIHDEQGREVLVVIDNNLAIPLGYIQTDNLY